VTPPPNQLNGFGRFEVAVSATGTNRASPLVFSLLNTGLGLTSFEELSTGGAVEGNVFFSAHVAGFTLNGVNSSGFFGGSTPTPVPLPSSLLLFPAGLAMLGLRRRERRLTARVALLSYFFAGSRTLVRSRPTTMVPVKPPSRAAVL
jgi:hypothetical protein